MGFWAERPQGMDFFEKCRSARKSKSKKCQKIVRNGSGKVLPGSRQVRTGQNCVANPMECLSEDGNGTERIKWNGKRVGKSKDCPKVVRKGSGKVLPGSRQVRMHQNCVPNPMECLPDPNTSIRESKRYHRPPI